MLYLVISTPAATRPSEARGAREAYWRWTEGLRERGLLLGAWSRVGRGAVALFDVSSHDALHALLNDWAELVPATFEVLPLLDPAAARAFLNGAPGEAASGEPNAG